jgi:hypothetical protein
MTAPPTPTLAGTLQRAVLALASVLLALAGFVLMIGALAVGLLAAAGWYVWSLLRGKPASPMRFSWPPPRFGGMGRREPPPPAGDVVDVQVREVPARDDLKERRDDRSENGQ